MEITAWALTLLAVLHHVTSAGVRVKAPLGGNASVHCSYSRGSETYPKYFSKGGSGVKTLIVRVVKPSTAWSRDGRFSLRDDREKREFTVSIRNLTVEDAGPYWCGVDQWGRDELTEVDLNIVDNTNPSLSRQSNGQPSTQTESAPFESTPSPPEDQDESPITGEPVIVIGCLVAALLLAVVLGGIMSGIFIKVKRNTAEGATASCHGREKSNGEHAEEDYVGMKPGIFHVRSPMDEDSSSSQPHSLLQLHHPNVAVVSSETDAALLLQVQACVFPRCSDPPTAQQSIYQSLRIDSQQESVYHTINPTSR